ncbi:DUF2239 family protein [Derxia gummosa]|uniref:DUF2239 family protein n=1 Tax=Derxia gummosa DSM 723 TaxID=1121388 RepID=A0A8B6X715_9BURK|nr:DUF2239 family protein [Derxia gummosa]
MNKAPITYTSFAGHRRIAAGSLLDNVLAARDALGGGASEGPVLVFDDMTGKVVDVDTRGSAADIANRLAALTPAVVAPFNEADSHQPDEPRGRGRPRIGVVPREITLLPRHWEWLAAQPGGASVALRKLVEDARRSSAAKDRQREAQERAYNFMSAMAGDLPGFEEATRALFANDLTRLNEITAAWPSDVRTYAQKLSASDIETSA